MISVRLFIVSGHFYILIVACLLLVISYNQEIAPQYSGVIHGKFVRLFGPFSALRICSLSACLYEARFCYTIAFLSFFLDRHVKHCWDIGSYNWHCWNWILCRMDGFISRFSHFNCCFVRHFYNLLGYLCYWGPYTLKVMLT